MGGRRLLAPLLLAACGSGDRGGDAAVPDLAGADDLGGDETAAFDRAGLPSVGVQQLTVLADSFFGFDATLDAALDANGNAAAIEGRLDAQLGAGDGGATACGSIMRNRSTVTASFGTGCTLSSGVRLAGSVVAMVSKSASTIAVQLDFSFLAVNDKNLGGSATFSTTNGTSFLVNATFVSTTNVSATNLMVSGSGTTITVSGLVGISAADGSDMTMFNAVSWRPTDCYPSGGTLEIKSGFVDETVAFDAATAATGAVTITVGARTRAATLPAYGRCPSADGG